MGCSRIMQQMWSTASETLSMQLEQSRKINQLLQEADFLHEIDDKVSKMHEQISIVLQILQGSRQQMSMVEGIANGMRKQDLRYESMGKFQTRYLELC